MFKDCSQNLMIEDLPGEIWYNVGIIDGIDYTGHYVASNFLRIKSLDKYITEKSGKVRFVKGRILKLTKENTGYYSVSLYDGAKGRNVNLHRIIATLFVYNDDPKQKNCVNHKDENKLNNLPENLEWCTIGYNVTYGTVKERRSEIRKIKVVQFDKNGNFIKEWDSAMNAEKDLGIRNVTSCCKKKRKTAGGYVWMYLSEYLEAEDIKV